MSNPTRIGKIARLPRHLRDAVNRRLDNAQPAATILAWLNAEEDAQEVLDEQFEGAPITEQNLSVWRQGGYQDWLRQQEDADFARQLAEPFTDADEEPEHRPLSDWLAPLLSLKLARVIKTLLDQETDPEKSWQRLKEFLPVLSRLRRDDHRAIHLRREQRCWASEDDASEAAAYEADYQRMKQGVLNKWNAVFERDVVAMQLGGGKDGYAAADTYLRVKYDLARSQVDKLDAEFDPVQPSQGKSSPIQPANPTPVAAFVETRLTDAAPVAASPSSSSVPHSALRTPHSAPMPTTPPLQSSSTPATPVAAFVKTRQTDSAPVAAAPTESNPIHPTSVAASDPPNTPRLPHSNPLAASSSSSSVPHSALRTPHSALMPTTPIPQAHPTH